VVSLLRSFVLIFLILYFKKKKNVESEEEKTERKKKFCYVKLRWNESFLLKMGFLKKEGDKKGHVFELLFSDGLYNCARGGEERSIFRCKSFNVFCFGK